MIRGQKVDFRGFEEKFIKAGQVLAQYAPTLVAAYLFGSAATGKTTPLSDIDIALLLTNNREDVSSTIKEKKRRQKKVETKILLDLMKVFGTAEIDLLNLNEAPLRIQYGAIKQKRLIYCSDEQKRVDFETAVLMKYLDFKHLREEYNREFLRELQKCDKSEKMSGKGGKQWTKE